jgi:5-methylcytosine-specific restriction endonuclease McrA
MGIDVYSLPEYTEFSKKYYELLDAANKYFYECRKASKDVLYSAKIEYLHRFYADRREIYDSYMSSPEWAAKRQQCYQVHGTTCVDCMERPATDIHHKHYETLGDECPQNDIVPLCSQCHKARHDSGDLENAPKKYAYGNGGVKVGKVVDHPRFGKGLVVEVNGSGKMARVKVNFCDFDRWLVLAYAPLRLIG